MAVSVAEAHAMDGTAGAMGTKTESDYTATSQARRTLTGRSKDSKAL